MPVANKQQQHGQTPGGERLLGEILRQRYVLTELEGADQTSLRFQAYDLQGLEQVQVRIPLDAAGRPSTERFVVSRPSAPPTIGPIKKVASAPKPVVPRSALMPPVKTALKRVPTPPPLPPEAVAPLAVAPPPPIPVARPVAIAPPPVAVAPPPPVVVAPPPPVAVAPPPPVVVAPPPVAVAPPPPVVVAPPPPAAVAPPPPVPMARIEQLIDRAAAPADDGPRPRRRTMAFEAAWFATGDLLQEQEVSQDVIDSCDPLASQEDIERMAGELSEDAYRQYALDVGATPLSPPAPEMTRRLRCLGRRRWNHTRTAAVIGGASLVIIALALAL